MNFSYESSGIPEEKVLGAAKGLLPYIELLNKVAKVGGYVADESSINLPFDEGIVRSVEAMSEQIDPEELRYIIIIGIGGSNLGTKAVYSTVHGFYDVVEPDRFPKMIFLDTNDPTYLHKVMTLLSTVGDPKEVLINAVSKSGKTTETTSNLEILINRFPEFKDRLVITTDEKSTLWDKDVKRLGIPEKVGGRYSIFSCVGLFPLSIAGIDIAALLEGARSAGKRCLTTKVENNPAALSAATAYLNFEAGRNINDNFFFHSELEDLGKWYRQLAGESLGKGRTGATPTVSIGSTDLHSVGQLYLGGKDDKAFTFVWAQEEPHDIRIAEDSLLPMAVPEIRGKSAGQIKAAILKGVKESYRNNGSPFTEIILKDVSEFSIGEYMQFKMIETMLSAKLFGVNAFDQPNVEQYKIETRKILTQK